MLKKFLALTTAGCIVMAAFAGCSASPSSSTAPDSSSPKADSSALSANATADFTGYPMGAEDTTITWYVQHGYVLNEAYGSADESPFHSGLSEMAGVNIEWIFPTTGTDNVQDFNIMLASDTLPDIMYGNVMKESERYIKEGVIRDITDLIEENAPAYYAYLNSNPTYNKSMKTDNGNYFGFGFFREDGGWNDSYLGPVIRKDWLDEQNLEIPETISDWDNVLRVFKEKYNSTFTFTWNGRVKASGFPGAFGAYGTGNFTLYVDDNNKIQLAQAQPEWRDYMKKLSEWWAEKLIDPDAMTLEDASVQTKVLNGESGFSFTSMGQISNWEKDAEAAGNGAEWIGIPYPTAADGSISSIFGGYGVGPDAVSFITPDCPEEKVGMAMRLLDYAYTDEGSLYWNFGKEGVSWEYDENNKPAYLPLVTEDADGLNNAISKYGGSTWSGSCIQATDLLYMKNTETAVAANDTWFYTHEEVTAKDKIPPGVTLTAEEADEAAELRIALDTYVSETASKYITGEESIDNFDNFVKQLDDMGLQRVLEMNQAAYDRFMSR